MNTEDRELLETAAKAAGFGYGEWTRRGIVFADLDAVWNPLEDDGDAFRLMVALGLLVGTAPNYPQLIERWAALSPDIVIREPDGKNAAAATRRAIVRAAAEIGRRMA